MTTLTLRNEVPALSSVFPELFEDSDFFFEPYTGNGWLKTMKVPATNVSETDNEFRMEIAAPGFKKDDFRIKIENGILEISSEKEMKKESNEDEYSRQEYDYSAFTRSFSLPEDVNPNDIKANYADGILRLTLPKKAEAKGKKLVKEIKVS